MSVIERLGVAAVKECRLVSLHDPAISHNCIYEKTDHLIHYMMSVGDIVEGCNLSITRWWSKAVSWMSRLCNYGYWWMPTTLPWNTRLLWRLKYENRTAGSVAVGWEISTEWSHGGRKECKLYSFKLFVSISIYPPSLLLLFFCSVSFNALYYVGSPSLAWN